LRAVGLVAGLVRLASCGVKSMFFDGPEGFIGVAGQGLTRS